MGPEIYFTAWDNGGGLFHFDRAKRAPELLVPQAGAWDLTGTSDLLEWTNWNGSTEGGGVYAYSLADGKTRPLVTSASPRDVWRDGEGVYFVDDFEQGISGVLDNSPSSKYPIAAAAGLTLAAPTTDQNYAYWASTTEHAIFAAPKRGNGQVRKAVDVPGVPSWTLVDGGFLYVAYSATGDAANCGAGAIARGTLRDDGTVDPLQPIAPDQRCPTALTARGDFILWTEDTAAGAVRRYAKTAGSVETIIGERGRPFRVRADDRFAYFLEFTTRQLWQVALP